MATVESSSNEVQAGLIQQQQQQQNTNTIVNGNTNGEGQATSAQQQQQQSNDLTSSYKLPSQQPQQQTSGVASQANYQLQLQQQQNQLQLLQQQQQGQQQQQTHFSSTNKQLVENAKNAIAQAAQEIAQQQQHQHQQQLQQQQQHHQQQQLHYHLSPQATNTNSYVHSPITASPSDISPNDGQVQPYPSDPQQQQRYATLASLQQQLQQAQHQQQLQQQGHMQQSPQSPTNQAFAQVLVANLPGNLTQSELADIFASLPSYERCGIALDPNTGISIGRGWLVFSSTEHANQAIAKMNGIVVAGHPLHLSMMQPIGESTKSNIYVAGLPKQYTQSQLEQLFQTFGTIIESKILTDPAGLSRGVAFVRYDNSNSAAQAITAVNGHVMSDGLHSYTVRVKFARDHHRNADPTIAMLTGQVSQNSPPTASGLVGVHVPRSAAIYQSYIPPHIKARGEDISGGIALFVFHIPAEFTSRDLQELFAPCATVLSARIAIHPQTLESKGFGFVTVSNLEEAHQAVTLLNGRRVGRKFIKVSFKKQQSPAQQQQQQQGLGGLVGVAGQQQGLGGLGLSLGGLGGNQHQGQGLGGLGNGLVGGGLGLGGGLGGQGFGGHSLGGRGGLGNALNGSHQMNQYGHPSQPSSGHHSHNPSQGGLDSQSLSSLAAALNLSNFSGLQSLGGSGNNGNNGSQNGGYQTNAGGWSQSGSQTPQQQSQQGGQGQGQAPQTPNSPSLLNYSQQNLPLHLLMQQMQLSNAFPAAGGYGLSNNVSPGSGGNQGGSGSSGNGAGSIYSYSPNNQGLVGGGQQGNNVGASANWPPSISLPQSALGQGQNQQSNQQQPSQSQQGNQVVGAGGQQQPGNGGNGAQAGYYQQAQQQNYM